nr:immunoglobulin heavy chain junction region [Mus musculus]
CARSYYSNPWFAYW